MPGVRVGAVLGCREGKVMRIVRAVGAGPKTGWQIWMGLLVVGLLEPL